MCEVCVELLDSAGEHLEGLLGAILRDTDSHIHRYTEAGGNGNITAQ